MKATAMAVVLAFSHCRTLEDLKSHKVFSFLNPYPVDPGECGSAFRRLQLLELFKGPNYCR